MEKEVQQTNQFSLKDKRNDDDAGECGKKKSFRRKEKLCDIEDNVRRTITLSRRKSTMFNNAFKLNVMTGADFFLLIETPRKRLAWGSDKFMSQYKNGTLKSIVNQEIVNPLNLSETSLENDNVEGVQPSDNTPDKVEVNSGLASVLGVDSRNITDVTPCNIDKGNLRPKSLFGEKSRNLPEPVAELIMNAPMPKIREEEIPQQYEQPYVPVTFINENQVINFVTRERLRT